MRAIKFRAWDYQAKRIWDEVSDVVFFRKDSGEKGLSGIVVTLDTGRDQFISSENIQLLQFTGLTDKNGKEIYEGDIFDMGVVIFNRGCFNGCYISGSTNERGWDYSDDWEDGLEAYARKHEVKGNIYENPDLLK